MYKAFFGLTENPFSISPNPRYFYLSERHAEALAHLTYGLEDGGGFVLLTGEVGTGKTTASRCLRRQLPENTDVAFVLNPSLTEVELLASICDEFGLDYDQEAGLKTLFDRLKDFLLANRARGRKTLLLIDEAQHLSPAVLEQLRLLTNLETDEAKLLQVVLIGQPELQQLLRQPLLRQLAQRITARYHLLPLSRQDVDAYVRFRLQVAGCLQPLFTSGAIGALHRLSGGIPRIINLICERALLAAYAAGRPRINRQLIRRAAVEALGDSVPGAGRSALAFGICGLLMLAAGWWGWQRWGWMPPQQVHKVEVPVKQPPDAKLMTRFDEARTRAGFADEAMQQLYRVWGYEASLEEATCEQAYRAHLRCEQGSGALAELVRLDHPAMVRLVDADGQELFAILVHIDDKEADLLLGAESWTVTRDWLEQSWGDEYSLLWKLPAGGGELISARSGPADIQWLDTALSQALGEQGRTVRRFDAQLDQKLRRFQAAEGLQVDGVAGPQTLMRLNARSLEPMPRLTADLQPQPEGSES